MNADFNSIIQQLTNSIIEKSGSSSVGRAIAFQAIGREFEPRLPLRDMSDFGFSISDLIEDGWMPDIINF